VEFKDISKSFPGVKALDEISFRVEGGRVCALLGENGAGKSTLLKILSGDLKQDKGTLSINGNVKDLANPHDAILSGISVVYQERQLVPMLSVMENVFLEDLPSRKLGIINNSELRKKTQEIIDKFGLPIDPLELVGRLNIAYQQMVEIMKAYRRNSAIIAFDEPTAPLTDAEIRILFGLIKILKEEGKVILYVSHRLAEIFQITDEIVVLKDGRFVSGFITDETNEQELIKAMVGRELGDSYSDLSRNENVGNMLLEVKNLNTSSVHDISFSLRKGEVLGFAGLVGAGRTEVVRAIFAADPIISGEILVEGSKVSLKTPYDAIKAGIALCPEDRKEQGLVLLRSISNNISMPVLNKVKRGPFLNRKAETDLANAAVDAYTIKTPTIDKITMELSGGNQQKVILGRWTSSMMTTKILLLDEPTKGIDVKTKAEIYQMVCDLAKEGIGIIFISSELTEVLNLCDNIIVMHNGHITGRVTREEATEEKVLSLAMLE